LNPRKLNGSIKEIESTTISSNNEVPSFLKALYISSTFSDQIEESEELANVV
jgi:hypothetical protein